MSHQQKIKISVVIPVYNTGAYIFRCIESLKSQTLKELEFIFVDDRSKDESMLQVEEWAKDDSRVRIIRNEVNLGEGGSRNKGIEAARGIYINTIDPDDWVALDFYELLWAKAAETSADIVKGTRIKISEETHEELGPRSKLNEVIDTSLSKGEPLYLNFHYEHTTIIFKRSLLNENIKYGKSPNACDTTFLLWLCVNAKSFAIENMAYYYYLQRNGSVSAEYSFKRSINELISLDEQMEYFRNNGSMDEYAYLYCANRFYAYSARFVHAYESEEVAPKEKEKYISDLKEQIISIPEYTILYQSVPEIFAIVELGMVPAPRFNTDFSIFRKEVAEWMTFVLAFDKIYGDTACRKLENLLAAYFNKRYKVGAGRETLEKEISLIKRDLIWPNKRRKFDVIANSALKRILS